MPYAQNTRYNEITPETINNSLLKTKQYVMHGDFSVEFKRFDFRVFFLVDRLPYSKFKPIKVRLKLTFRHILFMGRGWVNIYILI